MSFEMCFFKPAPHFGDTIEEISEYVRTYVPGSWVNDRYVPRAWVLGNNGLIGANCDGVAPERLSELGATPASSRIY
jgi:hypothetical protein